MGRGHGTGIALGLRARSDAVEERLAGLYTGIELALKAYRPSANKRQLNQIDQFGRHYWTFVNPENMQPVAR